MGIIKDLWESAQNAKLCNLGFYSWFARWKDEHPEYIKTAIPMDVNKYSDKIKRKSRSFDEKYS